MFKCHVQIAPSYLTDLTKPYIPGREGLWSSTQQLLDEGPKTQKNYGDRAFSMCGPKLWNKLPLELRQKCSVESFKKGLKTHLFKEAYNIWTVLTYLKNVFYKYFRLLYFAFMYICILYSFMYACKILAPVLFHSCIAHCAVWNCALKEFIIIYYYYIPSLHAYSYSYSTYPFHTYIPYLFHTSLFPLPSPGLHLPCPYSPYPIKFLFQSTFTLNFPSKFS